MAAILASAITTVANVLSFGALFGGSSNDEEHSPLGGFVMMLLAPIAATLIQLAISRSREFQADQTGADIARDAEGLARALGKLDRAAHQVLPAQPSPAAASLFIVNPFSALDSMARWFSTHPSTAERIQRLREHAILSRLPAYATR